MDLKNTNENDKMESARDESGERERNKKRTE